MCGPTMPTSSGGADAALPNCVDSARPMTKCAQCGVSIEEASLLLVCRHHLCLRCAAHSMVRSAQPGKPNDSTIVQCRLCQAVTTVEDDAVGYLESFLTGGPDIAAASFVSSGPGSSTTQEMASPVLVGHHHPRILQQESDSSVTVAAQQAYLSPRSHVQPVTSQSSIRAPVFASVGVELCGSVPGSRSSTPGAPPLGQRARTPSPGNSLSVRAPRSVRFCGQCEERPADLLCEQCDEFFCRSCAAAIHRRGQMAKHQLRLHVGKEETQSSGVGIVERVGTSTVVPNEPVAFVRKFLRCPVHHEEPLQFFCLDCECECICAECALHGDHRGHEVLNLREAVKQLPERSGDLLAAARMRADEFTGVAERLHDRERAIGDIFSCHRQELGRQVEQVRASLLAEEKALVKEVQRCSTEVATMLQAGDLGIDDAIRETETRLSNHLVDQDLLAALNDYARLNTLLDRAPVGRHQNIATTELKFQLHQSFRSRLASINSLATQIDGLTPPSEPLRRGDEVNILGSEGKPRLTLATLSSWEAEADTEDRSCGPPSTPRFYGGGLSGLIDGQQEFAKGIPVASARISSPTACKSLLPAPTPAGQFGHGRHAHVGSAWPPTARFGS